MTKSEKIGEHFTFFYLAFEINNIFCSFSEATAMPAFLPQLSSMAKVGEIIFLFKNYDNNSNNNIIN
jgi:hypothetical protein